MVCSTCGQHVDPDHRFCPWCASPQQRKAVALFAPHPEVEAPGKGLRVSRYFDPVDGPPHTRLSVYDADGRVTSVIALDDDATANLALFLVGLGADAGVSLSTRRNVLDRLVDRLTSLHLH